MPNSPRPPSGIAHSEFWLKVFLVAPASSYHRPLARQGSKRSEEENFKTLRGATIFEAGAGFVAMLGARHDRTKHFAAPDDNLSGARLHVKNEKSTLIAG